MAWDLVLLDEVADWYVCLDQQTRNLVTGAITCLSSTGQRWVVRQSTASGGRATTT
jgi:hypothetical protein